LATGAGALLLITALAISSTGSAFASPLTPHVTSSAPCNVTVTAGTGVAVPSTTLIVGVTAGTTQLMFDCNDSSAAAVVAEASLLAATASANVIPTGEADTGALCTFAPSTTDTGCPAGTAGSCEIATFAVPATFTSAGDPNAVCPPSAAQVNAGLFGCALAVANAQEAEVAGAEYLIQYASQTTPPNAPTISALQTTGSAGSLINVSDAAGATGYWWGAALEAITALETGATAITAPSSCTGVGYGDVPSTLLADSWWVQGSSTEVGGGLASNVTISNDCYNGTTLTPPVLGGTITVPATVTSGTAYTVYLCEVNFTPYPSNDVNSALACGKSANFIDASFTFTAKSGVVSQNLPVANTVTASASSGFTDQLASSGNTGAVTYTQTAGNPSIVVSSSGAVSTSGALAAGVYTASGTTGDTGTDTGTFTYALTVTATTTTPPPPAPKASKISGPAIPGKTVTLTITGTHFTAKAKITGHAGTTFTVTKTTATKLTVKVKEAATGKKGNYSATIRFASGKSTSVKYSVK